MLCVKIKNKIVDKKKKKRVSAPSSEKYCNAAQVLVRASILFSAAH